MSLQQRSRGRPKGTGINDRQRLRDIATLIATQPQIKPTTAIKMLGEHDPSVIRRLRDKFYSVQRELMEEVRAGRSPSPAAGAIIRTLPGSLTAVVQGTTAIGGAPAAQQSYHSMPMYPPGFGSTPARTDNSIRDHVASIGTAALAFVGDGQPSAERSQMAPASLAPHGADPVAGPAAMPPVMTQPLPTALPSSQPLAKNSEPVSATDAAALEKAKLLDLAAYNVMLGFAIQATVNAIGHQTRVYEDTLRLPPIAALLRQQIAIGEMVMAMTWPAGQPRFEAQPATAAAH
jgi:hypothetical protein